MPLMPAALRRLVPARMRDDVRLRAAAVGLGVIPPRALHSADDVALLRSLAAGCSCVVEIGVYEGASAVELCDVLDASAELHLIDPFGEQPGALRAGYAATPWATRRVVERACRRPTRRDSSADRARSAGGGPSAGRGLAADPAPSGPRVVWHVAYSADVGRSWAGGEVGLVFVDGDHLEPGVRLDWDAWHPHVAVGGHVLFHDARLGRPGGRGLPGPTAVVDSLFRGRDAIPGWEIAAEVDRCVAVRRLR